MYFIKINGSGKIPDYLQIRDDHYALLAYFRLDKLQENLTKNNLGNHFELISKTLEKIDFGTMVCISIPN